MSFTDFRERKNIVPIQIPNKDKYYIDLLNIEDSWSGRADVISVANVFILEAEQQLRNSIELFEMGYFDCAFYSLRSAVDVATTIVFLADMPESERDQYLEKWKGTEDFPMQGQMVKMLSQNGDSFRDMKTQMPDFFNQAKILSAKLNKYVHKQGFQHFYVSRNHPLAQALKKSQEKFISAFHYYFVKCTGIVAVMRLAIDPFPILLMEDEILYRCYESLTTPYTEDFISEYIGQDIIDAYKQTARYLGLRDYFMQKERKNSVVFNITHYDYIDTKQSDEIMAQIHLMTKTDAICSLLALSCENLNMIYIQNGLQWYITDRLPKEDRTHLFSNEGLIQFFSHPNSTVNFQYKNNLFTAFVFYDEVYLIMHNTSIEEQEINRICDYVTSTIGKIHFTD